MDANVEIGRADDGFVRAMRVRASFASALFVNVCMHVAFLPLKYREYLWSLVGSRGEGFVKGNRWVLDVGKRVSQEDVAFKLCSSVRLFRHVASLLAS